MIRAASSKRCSMCWGACREQPAMKCASQARRSHRSTDALFSSTLAEIPRPEVRLLMHPDDAAARSIAEGDEIRIFNALGEVRCNAALGGWIRRGTVSLPKGI